MSQKYCTECGTALPEGTKFCERCGAEIVSGSPDPLPRQESPAGAPAGPDPDQVKGPESRRVKIIAASIILLLIIASGVLVSILPVLQGDPSSRNLPGSPLTDRTTIPVVSTSPATETVTTALPVREPDPFPGALALRERFPFGTGKVASIATVYRYWINDTYEWHNDMDNRFYVQRPGSGNKYLFVFVHLENTGDTRVWFPPAGSVIVRFDNVAYHEDRNHFRPDKATDADATPIEIREIQYYQKLNGDEYVEDFGYSHGTELGYLYPGKSNAVDGYIIYEVPRALTPDKTYVEIPFNGQDRGIWKLG